jgi:hypothetical protein
MKRCPKFYIRLSYVEFLTGTGVVAIDKSLQRYTDTERLILYCSALSSLSLLQDTQGVGGECVRAAALIGISSGSRQPVQMRGRVSMEPTGAPDQIAPTAASVVGAASMRRDRMYPAQRVGGRLAWRWRR